MQWRHQRDKRYHRTTVPANRSPTEATEGHNPRLLMFLYTIVNYCLASFFAALMAAMAAVPCPITGPGPVETRHRCFQREDSEGVLSWRIIVCGIREKYSVTAMELSTAVPASTTLCLYPYLSSPFYPRARSLLPLDLATRRLNPPPIVLTEYCCCALDSVCS